MTDAKDVVERLAKAIYRKRPDCAGKPWPLETEDQKRAYPHNPIAAVELSFDYAKAALQELSAMGLVVVNGKPLERIQRYVAMREEKPFLGLDDQIHGIHTGTEWEAELLFSDLKALASPKVQP